MEKPLYTLPEAETLLCIKRSKMFDLLKTGEIKAVKCGSRTLITAEALQDYIAKLSA